MSSPHTGRGHRYRWTNNRGCCQQFHSLYQGTSRISILVATVRSCLNVAKAGTLSLDWSAFVARDLTSSGMTTRRSVLRAYLRFATYRTGNFVALDLEKAGETECPVVDCFHEAFGDPQYEMKTIAKSFAEFLARALRSCNKLYWLT